MATTSPRRALPRGPHRLTREEIASSQRQRLLDAMAEAVADKGYANTVVADVISRAGVSRATFYDQFRDIEDCFEAAYDTAVDLISAVLEAELASDRAQHVDRPLERLEHLLTTYLAALQAYPALAKIFLVEVYAAGPRMIERRRRGLDRFADLLAETHRGEQGILGTEPHQRFAAEAVVGAVSSLVTNVVGVGDIDGLADLREPLLALARTLHDPPRG